MKFQWQYCGACDRTVRVLVTDRPSAEGQAPAMDAELVCLEVGHQCTGGMCPMGAGGAAGVVRRIVQNGYPLDSLDTANGHCPVCDSDAEMILYGSDQAGCSICGTTGRWAQDHIETG